MGVGEIAWSYPWADTLDHGSTTTSTVSSTPTIIDRRADTHTSCTGVLRTTPAGTSTAPTEDVEAIAESQETLEYKVDGKYREEEGESDDSLSNLAAGGFDFPFVTAGHDPFDPTPDEVDEDDETDDTYSNLQNSGKQYAEIEDLIEGIPGVDGNISSFCIR